MTDTEAQDLVEKVLRLGALATPGPWEWHTSNSQKRLARPYDTEPFARVIDSYVCSDGVPDLSIQTADMALIAEYRTAAPELARMVLELKVLVMELENERRRARNGTGR